jgi:hypothetical protein
MNEKPEMWNRRFNPMGLGKSSETRRLIGMGHGFARQQSAGQVFGRIWNNTDPVLRSKPGPVANANFPAGLELYTCGLEHSHIFIGKLDGHSAVCLPH